MTEEIIIDGVNVGGILLAKIQKQDLSFVHIVNIERK